MADNLRDSHLTVENVQLLDDDDESIRGTERDDGRSEKSNISKSSGGSVSHQIIASESAEVTFSKGKPLPPIGSQSLDTIVPDKQDNVEAHDTSQSNEFGGKSLGSAKSSASRSSKTVSFIDGESSKVVAMKSVTKKIGYDGIEHTMVTMETQTEWSWLEDSKVLATVQHSKEMAQPEIRLGSGLTSIPDEDDGSTLTDSSDDVVDTDDDSVSKDTDDQKKKLSPSPTKSEKSLPSEKKSTKSLSEQTVQEEVIQDKTTPVYPEPTVNDEYGIPLLDVSSDSDFSDIDEGDKVKGTGEKEDNLLPSIGPPQILQYKRESEEKELDLEDPETLMQQQTVAIDELMEQMQSGMCHFCSQGVKPFPTAADQKTKPPDQLYCCNEYRDFVHFSLTNPLLQAQDSDKKIDIKPHTAYGSKQARRAARERAQLRMREREVQKQQAIVQTTASSAHQSSNFFSNSASRFTELQVPFSPPVSPAFPATGTSVSSPIPPSVGGGSSIQMPPSSAMFGLRAFPSRLDVFPVARQMKTINYQLSSLRCLEEGWTVRPPSPLDDQHGLDKIFEPEPLSDFGDEDFQFDDQIDILYGSVDGTTRDPQSERDKAWKPIRKGRRRPMIEQFFENGRKFMTIFPDGSGNVFYPSGKIAIVICRDAGQLSYIIQDETGLVPSLLAVFEPSGYATCYYNNGKMRLHLNQLGGVELDVHGSRKRRWFWKDHETHVHAPPFQPICFAVNNYLSIRVMNQEKITLTFRSKDKSCRFNVGTRLKLMHPELLPPKEIDEDLLYINDVRAKVETLLNKVFNLLKFPKSPKLESIKPPHHVTSLVEKNSKMRRELVLMSDDKSTKKSHGQTPVVRVN